MIVKVVVWFYCICCDSKGVEIIILLCYVKWGWGLISLWFWNYGVMLLFSVLVGWLCMVVSLMYSVLWEMLRVCVVSERLFWVLVMVVLMVVCFIFFRCLVVVGGCLVDLGRINRLVVVLICGGSSELLMLLLLFKVNIVLKMFCNLWILFG